MKKLLNNEQKEVIYNLAKRHSVVVNQFKYEMEQLSTKYDFDMDDVEVILMYRTGFEEGLL